MVIKKQKQRSNKNKTAGQISFFALQSFIEEIKKNVEF